MPGLKVYIHGKPKLELASLQEYITASDHEVVENLETADLVLVIIDRETRQQALKWISAAWDIQPDMRIAFLEYEFPCHIINSTYVYEPARYLRQNLLEEILRTASTQIACGLYRL